MSPNVEKVVKGRILVLTVLKKKTTKGQTSYSCLLQNFKERCEEVTLLILDDVRGDCTCESTEECSDADAQFFLYELGKATER